MIIFDLVCQQNHYFEGWFQSHEDFTNQLDHGLISCPKCASLMIRRVPSAVHLSTPGERRAAGKSAVDLHAVDFRMSAREVYRQLTQLLLASCENVGSRFPEEARRIHSLEVEERSICGEATAEEFEALIDEGIEVLRLSLLKPGDLH